MRPTRCGANGNLATSGLALCPLPHPTRAHGPEAGAIGRQGLSAGREYRCFATALSLPKPTTLWTSCLGLRCPRVVFPIKQRFLVSGQHCREPDPLGLWSEERRRLHRSHWPFCGAAAWRPVDRDSWASMLRPHPAIPDRGLGDREPGPRLEGMGTWLSCTETPDPRIFLGFHKPSPHFVPH